MSKITWKSGTFEYPILAKEDNAINIIKKSDNIENVYINNIANLLKEEKVKEAYDYGIKIRNIEI